MGAHEGKLPSLIYVLSEHEFTYSQIHKHNHVIQNQSDIISSLVLASV